MLSACYENCYWTAVLFGKGDQQTQWVCDHLGHTFNIHREHYRATSDVLERVQIAKLKLLHDENLVGKYHGKNLEDIQLEGTY